MRNRIKKMTVMLTDQYKTLVQLLIEKTDAHILSWQKGDFRFSFQAVSKDNKFRVSKYFAGDDNAPCLNLTAFDKDGVLVSEIVICKEFADQQADYDLLNALYSRVETSVNGVMIQEDQPVISMLIQSLQA